MLSICHFSTPDEVSAYAERIRFTPDESHMLCIFLPRMNHVPAFSVLVGDGERGGIQVECWVGRKSFGIMCDGREWIGNQSTDIITSGFSWHQPLLH